MSELVTPTQASALKVNDHMCINGRPCKILKTTDAKTGKHGGRKIHFFVADIFTDQKHEYLEMSTKNINAPLVSKNDYQLMGIDGKIVSYFDHNGCVLNDLFLPDLCKQDIELSQNIKNKFADGKEIYINVISSMGMSEIKGFRINTLND